jgi:signal transduction histidine kinase
VLYGLFGLAAGLWGIRTLTFVIETVPLDRWLLWRLTYLGATGGFIVAMAILALRFADIRRAWVERALVFYWLLGPVWLLAGGAAVERLVNRYWIAGFLPVGIAIVIVSLLTMWRQRTLMAAVMPAAMVIAVLTGLHDYLVNWSFGGVAQMLLPGWAEHRIFLLHHGANLVLVAMGGLLTARFVRTLSAVEGLNQTLEMRVADRERELAANYARMAALQREHAATQERQLIMRELHDGLGSQLFVSLSRVERGEMHGPQIADALRGCIADMRLALDTLTPGDSDFRSTLGDFLFRWQGQLLAAGIHPAWTIDVPDDALDVSPHAALQLLRIAQEALTNVLKHARATRVEVRLRQAGDRLELEVQDDGCGAPASGDSGRGIGNMRARAQQLGGQLEVRNGGDGTCVALQVPMNAVLA